MFKFNVICFVQEDIYLNTPMDSQDYINKIN